MRIKIIDNCEKEFKTNYVIYLLRNLINSKIYIGQTINLKSRLSHHIKSKERQSITNSIKKYGTENFICEILDYANSFEELNDLEMSYISKYNSTDRLIGYNIRSGGLNSKCSESTKIKLRQLNSGKKVSEETKIKIKNSTTGDKNHFFGKKHTKETREKMSESWKYRSLTTDKTRNRMSESQLGRKHSDETKQKMRLKRLGIRNKQTPVVIIDDKLNIFQEFNNIPDCANFLRLNKRTIYQSVKKLNLVQKRFYILKKETFEGDLEKIKSSF